jgi:large subunit ribosomal protein L18
MTLKKVERRIKIKYRIRKNVNGTAERPRMSVFRSNKQIYVQIINDLTGKTLTAASSLGMEAMPKKEQAAKVGELVAKKALEAGVAAIKDALIAGDKVALVGFGTFAVSERPAREGINPATKEKIQIAAKKVAKFKAGAELADALN